LENKYSGNDLMRIINNVYSKWETLSPVGWQAFHVSRLWIRLWPNLQIKGEK
jgi:hypothetical protein